MHCSMSRCTTTTSADPLTPPYTVEIVTRPADRPLMSPSGPVDAMVSSDEDQSTSARRRSVRPSVKLAVPPQKSLWPTSNSDGHVTVTLVTWVDGAVGLLQADDKIKPARMAAPATTGWSDDRDCSTARTHLPPRPRPTPSTSPRPRANPGNSTDFPRSKPAGGVCLVTAYP